MKDTKYFTKLYSTYDNKLEIFITVLFLTKWNDLNRDTLYIEIEIYHIISMKMFICNKFITDIWMNHYLLYSNKSWNR